MGWLDGRVALVTGGGSGIGRGVVETFIEEGAKVGILEISPTKVAELKKIGAGVEAVQGDATSLEDNGRALSKTVSRFGKLDILVCCPGLFDYFTPLRDLPAAKLGDAFDEIFAVNVKSYVLSTKVALEELLKNEGCIVYTLSNSSFYPAGGGALYMATKFALRGLVTQMAYELAPKVRVNGVAPGGTMTDLRGLKSLGEQGRALGADPSKAEEIRRTNPLRVVATPKDHSWAYVYLASKERSRAVTGTIIQTDGGLGVRGLTRLSGLSEDRTTKKATH